MFNSDKKFLPETEEEEPFENSEVQSRRRGGRGTNSHISSLCVLGGGVQIVN